MERNYLICMLAGFLMAQHYKEDLDGDSLRVLIDQRLGKCCLPLLGAEKGDVDLIDELLGEVMIYVIGQGINRTQRRHP